MGYELSNQFNRRWRGIRVTYNRIEVKPLSGTCGAEIFGIDLSEDLGNEAFAEVQRAFHENLVIFFRDQDINEVVH